MPGGSINPREAANFPRQASGTVSSNTTFTVLDTCACPSAVPIISDCNAELVFPPLSHDCLEGQTFHQSSLIESMHGRKERAKMWDEGTEAKGKRNREGREIRRGMSAPPPPLNVIELA